MSNSEWIFMGIDQKNLLVGNYMTAYPISVAPNIPLKTIVDFMASKSIATMVVMESNSTMPLGIFTEREILHHISSEGKIPDKQIKEVSIQPFVSITPDTTIVDAARIMITKKSRLLVFADTDKLVGIITASDMLRALRKTRRAPNLEKVISNKIYECSPDDSILTAAKTLDKHGIGSVIVSKDASHSIFTQRDLVRILEKGIDLNEKVGRYSSSPLITAKRGILGNEAASIMAAHNIKRLVLTSNGDISGIVTARDVVDAFQMEQ